MRRRNGDVKGVFILLPRDATRHHGKVNIDQPSCLIDIDSFHTAAHRLSDLSTNYAKVYRGDRSIRIANT